eukprot:1374076-Pyramimonas_sp.AAC.1
MVGMARGVAWAGSQSEGLGAESLAFAQVQRQRLDLVRVVVVARRRTSSPFVVVGPASSVGNLSCGPSPSNQEIRGPMGLCSCGQSPNLRSLSDLDLRSRSPISDLRSPILIPGAAHARIAVGIRIEDRRSKIEDRG